MASPVAFFNLPSINTYKNNFTSLKTCRTNKTKIKCDSKIKMQLFCDSDDFLHKKYACRDSNAGPSLDVQMLYPAELQQLCNKKYPGCDSNA
ncbi:hypothetical protein DBY21_07955 [Candidatus Gastranaerophilales bacterium]|nr:MAG: hypothetical protein DBY21_07955 [Candidatus Gastranaerophilales bacterium]